MWAKKSVINVSFSTERLTKLVYNQYMSIWKSKCHTDNCGISTPYKTNCLVIINSYNI
jgi:hypothetical protein